MYGNLYYGFFALILYLFHSASSELECKIKYVQSWFVIYSAYQKKGNPYSKAHCSKVN